MISFKRASGRFSFHFREVYQKYIEYIGKILIRTNEILVKFGTFLEEILRLISESLPDDQGGFTCMHYNAFTSKASVLNPILDADISKVTLCLCLSV